MGSPRESARACAAVSTAAGASNTSTGWPNIGRYLVPSASSYGSPISSGTAAATPLTRKAHTFSRCQPARSSADHHGDLRLEAHRDRGWRREPAPVLYVPCMTGTRRRSPRGARTCRGIHEVFHARFTTHAYPSHTHDAWTLLIVDDGVVRYDLDRHEHGATARRR